MPSARLEVGGYFCTVQSFSDVMVIMIEVVALVEVNLQIQVPIRPHYF